MRDYALTYEAAVRQRTNRQETTMARHGTMPGLRARTQRRAPARARTRTVRSRVQRTNH